MTPPIRVLLPRAAKAKAKAGTPLTPPPDENTSSIPAPVSRSSSPDVDDLLRTDTPTDETSDLSLPPSTLSSPVPHTAPLTPLRPSPLGLNHEPESEPDQGIQWPTLPAPSPSPPAQSSHQPTTAIPRPMATAAIELFGGRRNQNPRKFLQDLQCLGSQGPVLEVSR
jgi:hypothetical protein